MTSVNVVLFGETGVGKSSVINMIAGHQVASVSAGAEGRTLSSRQYTFPISGRSFNVWDTAGLEKPESGAAYIDAVAAIFELIQELEQQGGVDLLLFCIRGERITETTLSNYRLIYEILCHSQVPIALVVTHLEREPDMDGWWVRNLPSLERCEIKCAGHACVTGLPTHSKYAQSRMNVEQLLCGFDGQGKYIMPANSWFIEFLRLFGWFAPLKRDLKKSKLIKILKKWCKFDAQIAEELAARLTHNASLEGGCLGVHARFLSTA